MKILDAWIVDFKFQNSKGEIIKSNFAVKGETLAEATQNAEKRMEKLAYNYKVIVSITAIPGGLFEND